MTVHVLDTGAVIDLLRNLNNRAPFRTILRNAANAGEPIYMPAPVLMEVGWPNEPPAKRLDAVLQLVSVEPVDQRIANLAVAGLRTATRPPCKVCGGLSGPSAVDAIVMAMAHDFAERENCGALVYTQDPNDLGALHAHFNRAIPRRV